MIELSFGCPVVRVRLRRDKYVFYHCIFFVPILCTYNTCPSEIRVSDSGIYLIIFKAFKFSYINLLVTVYMYNTNALLFFVICTFRLFVVLKTRIQVFSFPKDPKLLFYFDTKENPKGMFSVLVII